MKRISTLIALSCLGIAVVSSGCLQPKPSGSSGSPEAGTTVAAPVVTEAERARAALDSYLIDCGGKLLSLQTPVKRIADSLSAQQLMYASAPSQMRDCSGIFHRVLQATASMCAGAEVPDESFRSSRDLAQWYAQRRELLVIQDALSQANLIKPGAVLFYGRSRRQYRQLTMEQVIAEIDHLGVVVSVTKDEQGNVTSYKLFHGRSPGRPAATTDYHHRVPPEDGLPPLGNWDQQWIAFARLCSASSL